MKSRGYGRAVLTILSFPLPRRIRNRLLNLFPGWSIAPTARIGISLILVDEVTMHDGSRIGHLNIIRGLERLSMDSTSTIGRLNYIYGVPRSSVFFRDYDRVSALLLGTEAALTSRHLLDCTSTIEIGEFAIVAGYRSQLLTHSVDISDNRQRSNPIRIGAYNFIGTSAVVLGGVRIASRVVVAAGSVVSSDLTTECGLYGGVPAKLIRRLPENAHYFVRTRGSVG